MNSLLIITSQADSHADYLMHKLIDKGITVVRLNTDDFSNHLSVTYSIGNGHHITITLPDSRSISFTPHDITAVWYRKPFLSRFDCTGQSTVTAFAGREIESYLADLISCLGHVKWINHPYANKTAENKIGQLRLAEQIGLRIPKTLITNDPTRAGDFLRCFPQQGIVYKTLSNPFISETTSAFRSVFTSKVKMSPEIEQSIKVAPCLFQEYIEKAYELRVTVVGQQVFAARILSQEHTQTSTDWRHRQDEVTLKHEVEILKSDVEQACVQIVKQLGLVFGAIDLIVTLDGKYVFLEINPNGQWLWVEHLLGLHISEALIEELITVTA
ncbi:MAG TPA: hypothetical protein DCZ84_01770 [Candidatus Vogelbacteria bacterium]|uniref:ATP-grasp domain-containing protein n=1 Tax=Candidatus Vogelbacteria bacterium RIFOXYD1_FULL_51_18 TaxID=1802440 RepID=A0A1G2QK11_9BACT|nr:MAG: hypothetical protein UY66_C0007G0002 [Parcubacteria group bacterium GW2011_GWC1_51_35]KKW25145.1 MAG: hypothetical protein UY68_C0005G0003 [Parcubacteria group bacterium GW2011_GWF2_52_12]OHA60332.1 MAG: hypothetical protein A2569_02425 [Candidatus Vogelbacteria bacterium RIFOXYD1_FULL_51_18]HBB65351.1 hypothetical protein [Candidatus Vogelbacteria bacterium]HCQ92192.1 hypothetical protein [Candidatus Vogelbacteria bacterium]